MGRKPTSRDRVEEVLVEQMAIGGKSPEEIGSTIGEAIFPLGKLIALCRDTRQASCLLRGMQQSLAMMKVDSLNGSSEN